MMRLSLLLLTAVLTSAFYLVRLQYQSRLLFTALDREQSAAHKLETEREALDVQKRAQAAALRVDSTARTRLGMREASPSITQYVAQKTGAVSISGPAAATRSEQPVSQPAASPLRRQP